MTSTIVIWPVIAALCKASLFLGVDPGLWYPINQKQEYYVQNYHVHRDATKFFNEKELRSWASKNHNDLNRILVGEGFSIKLEPFTEKGFGVVSILDIAVEWLVKGTKSEIYTEDNKKYSTIFSKQGFSVYRSAAHQLPILKMRTKNDDIVCMTIADKQLQSFELLDRVQEIAKNIDYAQDPEFYDGVEYPMIDLNQEVNIKWLIGMQCPGGLSSREGYEIDQALQQTKLKMNEVGARVKSAVAIGFRECMSAVSMPPKYLIINKPFYMWIERPGVPLPIFAGYLAQDCWKDPQNLDL